MIIDQVSDCAISPEELIQRLMERVASGKRFDIRRASRAWRFRGPGHITVCVLYDRMPADLYDFESEFSYQVFLSALATALEAEQGLTLKRDENSESIRAEIFQLPL